MYIHICIYTTCIAWGPEHGLGKPLGSLAVPHCQPQSLRLNLPNIGGQPKMSGFDGEKLSHKSLSVCTCIYTYVYVRTYIHI